MDIIYLVCVVVLIWIIGLDLVRRFRFLISLGNLDGFLYFIVILTIGLILNFIIFMLWVFLYVEIVLVLIRYWLTSIKL